MPTGHVRNVMYSNIALRGKTSAASRKIESQTGVRGPAFSSLSSHRRNLTTADAAMNTRMRVSSGITSAKTPAGSGTIPEEFYGTIDQDSELYEKARLVEDEIAFNDQLKDTLYNLKTMPVTKEKVWSKLLDLNQQNMTQ